MALTLAAFGLNVPQSLGYLWEGAGGDWISVGRTLSKATPLCLAGLGIVIAWRAGMYNIGGEGQYVFGGIGGAACAKLFSGMFAPALSPVILFCGALFGAALGALAGWLHVKRGVQVVISTILMNFLALLTLEWLLRGPLQESKKQIFVTDELPETVRLMRFDRQSDLHTGVFIALACVAVVWIYLRFTESGFKLRVVGESPSAARANKIGVGKIQIQAMAMSGGLCGLAGAVDYAGLTGRLADGFAQNWGFIAIPVALLGGLNPWGTLASALYFGGLFAGSDNLKRFTPIGNSLVPAVQGVAVLAFIGLNYWYSKRLQRQAEGE
ncbi:MAG: ABC transporter permease [Fimbriimonadaceae bacterium]